ncbi:TetR/AcrR family transcriptional regulator [Nocardia asteroides]|uniref:TetR/AcrR family transcriptional regulator n=1 Tax=Nocardia asteroides TaxID=1824 RepID=UPI003799F891
MRPEDQEPVDGRALRYRNRRGEVLDSVIEHVLEHGVSSLSFRTLAQSVGVSHVTLRHHFGSKEQLIAEIFAVIRRREAIPSVAGGEDVEALLRNLWQRWTTEEGGRRFRLLFEAYGQALNDPDRYRSFLDGVVADQLSVITELAVRQGCPPDEVDGFATGLLAHLRGLQLDLLATHDVTRVNRAFDLLIENLRRQRAVWTADQSS